MAEGTVRQAIQIGDVLEAELLSFDSSFDRRAKTMLMVLKEGLATLTGASIEPTWEHAKALLAKATHAERYEREIALAAETAREGTTTWGISGGLAINVLDMEADYRTRYHYAIRESGTSRLRYEGAFGNVEEVLLTLIANTPSDALTARIDALIALFDKLITQQVATPPIEEPTP